MQSKKVKADSSMYTDPEDTAFNDEVEETELRENVENYPDNAFYEDSAPAEIYSSKKDKTFYGDLEGLNQPYGNFQRRHMPFVNISSSELRYGNFEMANMVCASIALSKLQGSSFRYADMEYSEINKADLSSTDLSHVNLRGSNIKESDFRWSDLRGADLSDCTVQASKFQDAMYDEHTQLPFDKRQAKRMGMVFVSERRNAG